MLLDKKIFDFVLLKVNVKDVFVVYNMNVNHVFVVYNMKSYIDVTIKRIRVIPFRYYN